MINADLSKNSETLESPQEGSFPNALSIEDFHDHLVTLFFMQIRTISFLTNDETAWKITGKLPLESNRHSIFALSESAENSGLTYEDIGQSCFARSMEAMYKFAYEGVLDRNSEAMDFCGDYTLIANIVRDASRSLSVLYWDQHGETDQVDSSHKCFEVIELANARCILENNVSFLYDEGIKIFDENAGVQSKLTIRQMALLAGMEEMSVRAASNPKRANPLRTISENGRTFITSKDAKVWLIEKKRYVSVKNPWNDSSFDLTKNRFPDLPDLLQVIHERHMWIQAKNDSPHSTSARHSESFVKIKNYLTTKSNSRDADEKKINCLEIERALLSDSDLIYELAEFLEFPPNLFALRVRQVLLDEEMKAIKRELKAITR